MPKQLCLACDRDFISDVTIPQCGVCGSRDTLTYLQLDEIADQVSRHINVTKIDTLPFIEVMAAVLKTVGVRLRPVSTLRLCTKILGLLQAKWKSDTTSDLSVNTDRDRSL